MKQDELSREIQAAALALIEAILADPESRTYQETSADFQSDPEVVSLEQRLTELYAALIARQQAGEILSPEETAPLYRMREEYYAHPRVVARSYGLSTLRPLLADVMDQLSSELELNFAEMVRRDRESCCTTPAL